MALSSTWDRIERIVEKEASSSGLHYSGDGKVEKGELVGAKFTIWRANRHLTVTAKVVFRLSKSGVHMREELLKHVIQHAILEVLP